MATWANTIDNSTVEGDQPYGAYWIEIEPKPEGSFEWDGKQWAPCEPPAPPSPPSPSPMKQLVDLLVAKNAITPDDADALDFDQAALSDDKAKVKK